MSERPEDRLESMVDVDGYCSRHGGIDRVGHDGECHFCESYAKGDGFDELKDLAAEVIAEVRRLREEGLGNVYTKDVEGAALEDKTDA